MERKGGALQCDILLLSPEENVEAELSTLQFSIITISVVSGTRGARNAGQPFPLAEAKRLVNWKMNISRVLSWRCTQIP